MYSLDFPISYYIGSLLQYLVSVVKLALIFKYYVGIVKERKIEGGRTQEFNIIT